MSAGGGSPSRLARQEIIRGPIQRRDKTLTGKTEPRVYIVLVSWNDLEDTKACLRSLFEQNYSNFRVVVCNNAPGSNTLPEVKSWAEADGPSCLMMDRETAEQVEEQGEADIYLIDTGENAGFAAGNNVALRFVLKRGDADYIWLLNTDTVVDPGALKAMVDVGERQPDVGMLGAKLVYRERPNIIQFVGGGSVVPWRGFTDTLGDGQEDIGQWNREIELDYITGASLLARRQTIEEVGLMDERYFLYSEEVDWCIRARQQGWRLVYAPGSKVYHKGGGTVGHGTQLHDYYSLRSMLLLVQKFSPALLPLTLIYSMYRCLGPKVIRMQAGRLRAVLRAYRDFFAMVGSRSLLANPPRPGFQNEDPTAR